MSKPYPSADDYAFALESSRLAKHLRGGSTLLEEIAGGEMQVATGSRYSHVAYGFFAYIFRVKTAPGSEYALRCPRSRFPKDGAERYQSLAHFLREKPKAGAYLANADHFEDALFVSVQSVGSRFPVQVMEWVGGVTLLEAVTDRVGRGDKSGLRSLAWAWEQLLIAMKADGVVHADLHPENVIVSAGDRLRLVDYDTLIVPGFTPSTTSAGGMMTYFHPGYARDQKPRPTTPYMDDFGAINILLSLRALAINPAWRNSSEYLLFNAADTESPHTSGLFMELLHHPDPSVRTLTEAFWEECRSPTETGSLRVEQFVAVTPAVLPWGGDGRTAAPPGINGNRPSPVAAEVTVQPPITRRTYEFTAIGVDDLPTSSGKPVRRVVVDDYKP